MAVQDKATLKTYFETDDVPTESQYEDLIDSMAEAVDYAIGTIIVGATEATNPPARNAGANSKIAGIRTPHHSDAEEDVGWLGLYSTTTRTYAYIGGGFDTTLNAVTDIDVYIGTDATDLLGDKRAHIEYDGAFLPPRLGLGTGSVPATGINCVGQTLILGADDNDTDARTASEVKTSAIVGTTYANSESLLIGLWGTSSHSYLYYGGGLGATRKAPTSHRFHAGAGIDTNLGTEIMRFDMSTTAGDTRLMLWDVDAGSLVRVSVGAADSGGSGFKALRVPN